MHVLGSGVTNCSVVFRLVVLGCCCQWVCLAHLSRSLDRFVDTEKRSLVFVDRRRLCVISDPAALELFVRVSVAIEVPRVVHNHDEVIVIVDRTRHRAVVLREFFKSHFAIALSALNYV